MSISDDDNSKPGGSSPTGASDERRRMTMMGMGFSPRPGPPPVPELGDESTDAEGEAGLLVARLSDDEEDFADESTQMADHIGLAIVDNDVADNVRDAVERVVEVVNLFEEDDAAPAPQSTLAHPPKRPGLPPLALPKPPPPVARKPAPAPVPAPPPAAAKVPDPAEELADVWDRGIDELSLSEESLPEAIREPNPTLDDFSAIPDADITGPETSVNVPYIGDNQPVTEFEANATAMLDSPFESDPTVGKLLALDGPAAGHEFFASSMRNTVGRGTNNTIVVPDLAMSRQHFEITRNPDDTFTLYDLQSVNGTALNGTRVREADLFHGDRVEAGESSFQFVITGTAAGNPRNRRVVPATTSTLNPAMTGQHAAVTAPSPGMNRALVAGSVLAVLVSVIVIATVVILTLRKGGAAEPDAAVASASDASAAYLLGVEAVKSRSWDQAQAQFERARSLDPSLDGVSGQLERIEIERAAMAALDKGRELLDRNLHDEAVTRLDEVPRDSVYYAEARELARGARKAGILELYQDAQSAFDNQEYRRAQALVAEILTRVPEHRGALALKERLAGVDMDAGFADDPPDMGDQAPSGEVAVASAPSRPTSSKPARGGGWDIELVEADTAKKTNSASADGGSLNRGFLLYKSRKFQPAEDFFKETAADGGPNADRAKKMADAVKDFRTHYPPGVAAFKVKKWSDARRHLVAAKRADSVVGNYFDKDIRAMLASSEANLGLAALEKGDGVGARKNLDKARGYRAADPDVSKLEKGLEVHAKKLYIKAQALKKANPAKAGTLCREILAVVPPSNDTHKKAQELLASLPAR